MKKKEIQELKNRSKDQLTALVIETSEKLRALKFDLAAGKVKDVRPIHEAKKGIARMKTFIHQKESQK
jgi:ribosomal protein L29